MNKHAKQSSRILVLLILVAGLTSCASTTSLSSAAVPGNPILSFPSSDDRTWTTVLESNPYARQAGVSGSTLLVATFHHNKPVGDQLTLDRDGNLGLRGSISSVSTRKMKKDIALYHTDPLTLLSRVKIVTYRYKYDAPKAPNRIGFIAEDTPTDLSGPKHDSMNLNNTVGVEIAAIKELDKETRLLRSEINNLKTELAKKTGTHASVACDSGRPKLLH